jgi:hypothetical protein
MPSRASQAEAHFVLSHNESMPKISALSRKAARLNGCNIMMFALWVAISCSVNYLADIHSRIDIGELG